MIRASVHLERQGFSLDVDFQTESKLTGIIGPSGAGKTTLINLIAGLERPDCGSISLDGTTLFDGLRRVDVPAHRRRMGVVFQEHRLFPNFSVSGNLQYGRRPGSEDFHRIVSLLELGTLLQTSVQQLSGGERQRVALGRALLSNPRLLLLDEPLASLDQRLRQQIIPYLRRVRDELAVPMLYVSHELTEILQLTDQLLVLDRGQLVGHGRYADVVHHDAVQAVVHDRGMNNVLIARVVTHHPEEGITVLEIGPVQETAQPTKETLIAPLTSAGVGARVLISIRPWDIALATTTVQGVSIQNQVSGVVTRCTDYELSVLVDVQMGAPIMVEISRRSAAALNIRIGQRITCLIKTRAIQYIGTL